MLVVVYGKKVSDETASMKDILTALLDRHCCFLFASCLFELFPFWQI